jgi:hypothetical protein
VQLCIFTAMLLYTNDKKQSLLWRSMALKNWAIPTSVLTLHQWLCLMWYFNEWVFGRQF